MIKLDFYAIIQAIDELRIARNMKQTDLIKNIMDPSSYSKMKNNQLNINLEDAYKLLVRLNANWVDLEDTYFFISEEEKYIQDTYTSLLSAPKKDKKRIESFFLEIQNLYEKNGEFLRIYLLLKAYYSKMSAIIPKISREEMDKIFNRISQSTVLTSVDYKLIGDLTSYFTIEQLKILAPRILITDIHRFSLRSGIFQFYVPNCLSNIADIMIDNEEYDLATTLLNNLEEVAKYNNDFFLIFLKKFLEYRLNFFKESDPQEKQKILLEYKHFFDSANTVFGEIPNFLSFKQSFENLQKNHSEIKIIIRNK